MSIYFKIILICMLFVLTFSITAYAQRTGEQIYKTSCAGCHDSGLDGAPRFSVAEDWRGHKKSGEAHMLKHVIKGVNKMPPKGGCSDCSEDELKAAIQYILQNI